MLLEKENLSLEIFKNSFIETLFHVLKGNCGAGLFGMGDAFKNSGLIIGTIGTTILALICIYNMHLLVKLSRTVKGIKGLPLDPTFPETVTYCFEEGPPKFSRFSKAVMLMMKIFISVTQLGFCVVYITIVGQSAKTTAEHYWDHKLNARIYMIATLPIVLAVSLIHTLKFLVPVSAISTVLVLYGYAVSLIVSCMDLPDISERTLVAPVTRWPLFIGTVIFALEGIALVIPLKNEMKKEEQFDKIIGPLNIGMSLVLVCMISLGFSSYWRFGNDVLGSVTFNLPSSGIGESARTAVSLGILLTYPLQFYVPVKLYLKDIKAKWGPIKHPLCLELLLRVGLVICTYIIALLIPRVDLLLSLVGAVCSNALALLFPALSDISLRLADPKEDEKIPTLPKSIPRLVIDGVSIVLSILGAIFGAYVTIYDIILALSHDVKEILS